MKKMLFCAVVLSVAFTTVTFADRQTIEEVLQGYEIIVAEAEYVARMQSIVESDFYALQEMVKIAETMVEEIENAGGWALRDARQLARLNFRLNQAMTTIAHTLLLEADSRLQ